MPSSERHHRRAWAVVIAAGVLAAGSAAMSAPAAATSAVGTALAHAPGAVTVAGTGRPGFSGDRGPARRAELDAPTGIAEDAAGDLFIADSGNCRVREVPAHSGVSFGRRVRAGTIVTVAGGPCHDHGDPPPVALATDTAGDLFIAYPTASRVAVLAAHGGTVLGTPVMTGRLTTVAGTGVAGFSGDGGRATAAELDDPSGLAADPAGNLLVADTANCRVRLVAATTGDHDGVEVGVGRIATVAGTGICGSSGDGGPARQAQVWDPGALATDPAGDVYVADQGNRTVRVLAPRATTVLGTTVGAGNLATVAGEGSYGPYVIDGLGAVGEAEELNFPSGLAVDRAGNLLVSDGESHVIRLVANATGTVRGQPTAPGDLYTVAGALLTATLHNDTTWVGTQMLDPVGIAVSPDGAIVYADHDADVVRVLPAQG